MPRWHRSAMNRHLAVDRLWLVQCLEYATAVQSSKDLGVTDDDATGTGSNPDAATTPGMPCL
jgi:hypothetical protein